MKKDLLEAIVKIINKFFNQKYIFISG